MRKASVLLVLISFFIVGFAFWWRNGIKAVNPQEKSLKTFVIPKGATVRVIGNDLKSNGFIKDSVVFFLYTRLNNLDRAIQAGSYKLSRSMDLVEIMKTFNHGSEDIWITIPEGYRAAEIAEVLKSEVSTYDDSWISLLEEEEGFLFPDTYLIPKDSDIKTIISIFKNTFNAKIQTIGLNSNSPRLREIVTIASLIEREALKDSEKVLISSVIANRLEKSMALDIDATLQYVKGKDSSGKWWSIPTVEDRELNSPYNTYRNAGIPLGPIANPGLEAIKAAYIPAKSNYYFYIHDVQGNVHFAENLSKHNQNVEKYLN